MAWLLLRNGVSRRVPPAASRRRKGPVLAIKIPFRRPGASRVSQPTRGPAAPGRMKEPLALADATAVRAVVRRLTDATGSEFRPQW